jgi:hypothetical protein
MSLCKCDCGEDAGVYATDSSRVRGGHKHGEPRSFVHGHNGTTHGRARKVNGKRCPEYQAYVQAKDRCTNSRHPNWKDYGGRGIKFLFTSFQQFFAELGVRPEGKSLDRYPNNDGNYELGNVRWATRSEQQHNRRDNIPTEDSNV